MGRIIDKITARRKQFERQRSSQSLDSSSNHNHHETAAAETTTTTPTATITTTNLAPPQSQQQQLPAGWFYSFEFFPPKTEAGLDNLLTRIDRMAHRLDPLFINVTWSTTQNASRSLAVASYAQKYLGVDVLLHVSTINATREQVARVLDQAKASGITNILALRGDPPAARGQRTWKPGQVSTGGDCPRAIDLVKLIRSLDSENIFGIAVAGHPEGHPASTSPQEEMQHLQEKMEAGADFIITQMFYDCERFLQFVRRCRAAGITCPILPGIMPIQSFSSFQRMTEYCQIAVPAELWQRLEPVKGDDEAVKNIGCEVAAEMCRTILTASATDHELGLLDGVHFYTLNLERSVTNILILMGAVDWIQQQHTATTTNNADSDKAASTTTRIRSETDNNNTATMAATISNHSTNGTTLPETTFQASQQNTVVRATAGRALPWRPSAMDHRHKSEQIRPINWANRPKSYVRRTEDWDEFPNGRWGDATSPAFGELSDLGHFYTFSLGSEDDQRAMLGENPKTPSDVYEVFAKYVEGTIPHIPWCETPLQPESFLIQSQLSRLNRAGFLTINSQPAVNGAPSTHPTFGWGPPASRAGFVYQKAYCECFCSPEHAQKLVTMVRNRPSFHLYAVNRAGDEIREGVEAGGVTALTWGVFPNREILQPTVFDPTTFLVWAEEAFALWTTMWLNLYDFDSESYELIEQIRDTYYLCAVVDNDFTTAGKTNGDGNKDTTSTSSIWDAIEQLGGS